MGHTLSEHHSTLYAIAPAIWIIVGIVAVCHGGGRIDLLAFSLVIVTTACWIFGEVEHRRQRYGAQIAPQRHGVALVPRSPPVEST